MSIKLNRSVETYLQRKQIIDTRPTIVPKYEMGTLHVHSRPVIPLPWLRSVDSPGTKVVSEDPVAV